MHIKILDVSEKKAHIVEHEFKDLVIVKQNDDLLYDLTFNKECTLSTHVYPEPEIMIFSPDNIHVVWFFETDFSEVHII